MRSTVSLGARGQAGLRCDWLAPLLALYLSSALLCPATSRTPELTRMPTNNEHEKLKAVLSGDYDVARQCVEILALAPTLPEDAFQTLHDALAGADPLLQVAIMDCYFEMSGDRFHESDLEALMNKAAQMGDAGEQLYMAARLALGRVNGLDIDQLDGWGDAEIEITAAASKPRTRGDGDEAAPSITVVIHGTFAANGKWWRKGGDFFEYLRTDLGLDAYDQPDVFKWSGKNRDSKRHEASVALSDWLKAHPATQVNIFAHSHGANVAMLATRAVDTPIDRLVMLSPPVRPEYFADWAKVAQAFNIQASFDPVVALAKGGQWFRNEHVTEKKLKASGHSASHAPKVWRDEGLPAFVGLPWY